MMKTEQLFAGLLRHMLDVRVDFSASTPPEEIVDVFRAAIAKTDPAGTPEQWAALQGMNMVRLTHVQIAQWIARTMADVDTALSAWERILDDRQDDTDALNARILELEKHIQPERRLHPINDATVRDAVWTLTQGHCAYCDSEIKRDGQAESRGAAFCVEHVVPTSAGGPDNLANYVPACISCNSSKGDRHVLMLLRRMQRRTELVVVAENGKAVS